MRVVYISDDGKEFEDEYECMDYEWTLNHPYLKDIHFYDVNDNELGDVFSDETYQTAEKIVVLNENAVETLQELASYTGYCAYEDVNECGEWIFNLVSGFEKK